MSREHVSQGEAIVAAPIEDVWGSVSGFDELGKWAPDVADLERAADVNGLPSYVMHGGNSTITFLFREVTRPTKLVVEIQDDSESYGGVWTYELEEKTGGTSVRITEHGWTEPAYFRFMFWAFGYDRTIRNYLTALKQRHQ